MKTRVSDIILGVLFVVAALAGDAAAQSRHEVGIRGPSEVGWGPSARSDYMLNRYSTGLSDLNLGSQGPYMGEGVLGSSVYTGSSMTITHSEVATPAGAYAHREPAPLRPSNTGSRYETSQQIPTISAPTLPVSVTATSALVDYIMVQKMRQERIRSKVIMSLVPAEPGEYHDAMAAGEDTFRQGLYEQAVKHFEAARRLSKDSPASLYSAARAAFATATDSYAPTAQLICKVLAAVPELPTVHITPRTFYGKQSDLEQQVARLDGHVKAHPTDAGAQFVLGYIRWRQGNAPEARKALAVAESNTNNDQVLAAGIKALLKGMEMAESAIQEELPDMAEPLEYPHAGIRMALPTRYQLLPVVARGQILSASRPDDGRASVTITLDVRTVSKGVTAEGFWDYAAGYWQQGGMADLKLLEQRDVQVGGVDAVAKLFTYSSDGQKAAAVGVCFIRELKRTAGEPLWVAYLLLLKSPASRMTAMFPILNGIARSVSLSEIRRPIDIPIRFGGTAARDPLGRYSITVPNGWSFAQTDQGPILGQLDLLLGGSASPLVRCIVTDVPDSMDAKSCGLDVIAFVKEQKGHKVDIISQGAAKVGGKDGYQFVLRTRIPPDNRTAGPDAKGAGPEVAKFSDPFTQVVRLLGVPGESGRREYLLIALDCYDTPVEKAEAVMDKLAGGIQLLGWRHLVASP